MCIFLTFCTFLKLSTSLGKNKIDTHSTKWGLVGAEYSFALTTLQWNGSNCIWASLSFVDAMTSLEKHWGVSQSISCYYQKVIHIDGVKSHSRHYKK